MATKCQQCPACKVAVLNRYNSDPLCGPCLRAARDAEGIVPLWVWDSLPMRQALARTDPGAFLAVLRAAAGLSQLELANLVEGWSQSTVSLIERGQRATLYDVRELLRVADAVDMPREALLPLIMGRQDATLESESRIFGSGKGELDRRTFNVMAAGLALPVVLPQVQIPERVGTAHVHYLRNCAERLYRRDQNVGGAALLRQAVRQFHRARQMLDESDYPAPIGRELLAVAGDLATCAGWLAFDAGDLVSARQLYGEALLMAGSADDAVLHTHVLTNMSMLSCYVARTSGRRKLAREGLRFAEQAADVARHEPSPPLHTLISLRRSNAAALLGDSHTFKSAIKRAKVELDRGPHADDPEWIRFVGAAEVIGHEAAGHLNLGHPDRAERLYRSVLDDSTLDSSRNRAYYGALLAGALLEQGDETQAIGEGMAVLPALSHGVTSVRTLNELRPLRLAANNKTEEFCVRFDQAARALSAA
ncbi:helix-turn-helix transcriptional regulator [Actinomadura fulvescens]|uniref:HTH cro/C1-type domain-containing protein n=1 Tax=Actinomadura fulvescens TaxID=46160 RepID=A0ABP6CJE2_9ACTN